MHRRPQTSAAPSGYTIKRRTGLLTVAMLGLVGFFSAGDASAQRRPAAKAADTPAPAAGTQPSAPAAAATQTQLGPEPEARETVQADVSSRSVAVTSSFTGTEIVIFGSVDNSQQASPASGLYDVVIVVEGTPTRLVARKKSNVGIWINTASITFQSVPSYYAILSTRPLDEIADPIILRDNDIGFDQVRMTPISGWESGVSTGELEDFKSSIVRIKQRERLYIERPIGGVTFIGRSLFRAALDLPANVPVGPLVARVHLFRQGRLLHTFTSRVTLRREGLEHFLHSAAFGQPLAYGIATVLLSIAMGLAATTLFRKSGH